MKFAVSVRTPLIIGGNDEILEFDLFEKDGKAYVVDVVATSMNISDSESDKWINITKNFVNGKGRTEFRNSGDYLQKNVIKDEIQTFLSELYRSNKLRLFEPSFDVLSKGYRSHGPIRSTIHYYDVTSNVKRVVPYIPGSSIKGSIRKAILYRLIKNGVSVHTNKGQKRAIDLLLEGLLSDSSIFSYDSQNSVMTDVMKFLVVSDFLPTEDVNMGLFQVSGKVKSNEVKTTYLGILSGTFVGDIEVNPSLTPVMKGPLSSGHSDRLGKVLGLTGSVYHDSTDVKSLEKIMLKWILESVDEFSRDNGKLTGYEFDRNSKFIILGQGKGAPLTTVINASTEIFPMLERRGIRLKGRGGIRSLASPKTRSEVEMPNGKLRPGLCTVEELK